MDEIFRNMLKEEIAREEAEERDRNNGQLSAATQAAKAAAERSEATLRQMQGYSHQAGGAGNWQTGPSGPFLGQAKTDVNMSGQIRWELPQQNFAGAGYSGNQQGRGGGSGGGGSYMPQQAAWSGVNTWCNNLAAHTGGPTIFQREIGTQSYYFCAQCSRGGG